MRRTAALRLLAVPKHHPEQQPNSGKLTTDYRITRISESLIREIFVIRG